MGGCPTLEQPLVLPCGALLPNRIAKAAMSEHLADRRGRPTEALRRLYERWAEAGAGLLITGAVVVDRRQPGEPYNVVADGEADGKADIAPFARWAAAAHGGGHGGQVWMQLGHPGRQTPRSCSRHPVAPSAVKLNAPVGLFAPPRALDGDEIRDLITRFARAAQLAESVGFDGTELHAAHGYLISQFLTPLTNRRDDEWGRTADDRMRFLLETVRAIRSSVSRGFAVAVKLNASDFEKGGFGIDDALRVVDALNREGVDLLELSGGNYESAVRSDELARRQDPAASLPYYVDHARRVRQVARMPLMLTGGLRTPQAMAQLVSQSSVDMVGLARPFAVHPRLARTILAGEVLPPVPAPCRTGRRLLDLSLSGVWHQQQLRRLSLGRDPDPRRSRLRAAAGRLWVGWRWRLHLLR